jgi:hypothetical protein
MALAAGDNAISVLPLSVAYPLVKSTLSFALALVCHTLRNFWAMVNSGVIESDQQ